MRRKPSQAGSASDGRSSCDTARHVAGADAVPYPRQAQTRSAKSEASANGSFADQQASLFSEKALGATG